MKHLPDHYYLPTLFLLMPLASHCALAQEKSPLASPSSSCGRASALDTIREEIDFTRTFDDPVPRIAEAEDIALAISGSSRT